MRAQSHTLNWNTMNCCCSFFVHVFDVFRVHVQVILIASMDPSIHHHDQLAQLVVQSLHVADECVA